MKLLEFKENIRERFVILKANFLYSLYQDLAYRFNNWGNIISATTYSLITLVFVNIIYSNTKSIAGYSKDEILFMMLISQISFLLTWIFSMNNIQDLIGSVNSGELDLVLTKPVPSLFYVTFKNINAYNAIRDYLLGGFAMALAIQWTNIHITPLSFILGIIILICGFISSHVVHFIAALPVFWLGESSSILDLFFYIDYDFVHGLPYEGFKFNRFLQVFLSTVIPFLLASGLSTSVMLGKSNTSTSVILSMLVCIVALKIKSLLWNIAIKNYTSASS